MKFADEWADYERRLLDPINASPTQREEMKKAFYAGGGCMMGLMFKITQSPANNPTQLEAECRKLDEVKNEIDAFFASLL